MARVMHHFLLSPAVVAQFVKSHTADIATIFEVRSSRSSCSVPLPCTSGFQPVSRLRRSLTASRRSAGVHSAHAGLTWLPCPTSHAGGVVAAGFVCGHQHGASRRLAAAGASLRVVFVRVATGGSVLLLLLVGLCT